MSCLLASISDYPHACKNKLRRIWQLRELLSLSYSSICTIRMFQWHTLKLAKQFLFLNVVKNFKKYHIIKTMSSVFSLFIPALFKVHLSVLLMYINSQHTAVYSGTSYQQPSLFIVVSTWRHIFYIFLTTRSRLINFRISLICKMINFTCNSLYML